MTLYPNPATNKVNIMLNGIDQESELQVYDMQGRRVTQQKIEEGAKRITLDTDSGRWSSGVYMIMVNKGGKCKYQKLILNR